MSEIHVPLIPLGAFNILWSYANGRLNGGDNAQSFLIVMPPDGVFLRTLRVKGYLGASASLFIELFRTPKDDFGGLPSVDPIANQTIASPPRRIFDESIALSASGKNVVDNAIYNYTVAVVAHTTGPTDQAFIGEVALFY